MSVNWVTPPGNLGILVERQLVNIPLSATSTESEVSYSLIAGSLPRGLRISGNSIVGSPVEVTKFTESRFVIRASDINDEKDRTFKLSVDGSDLPEWITDEGFLNVGPEKAYFVLDNSPVNFQLEAEDRDENAGETLSYYLVPNSGQLPPGLSLSRDGIISGFTDPIFATVFDNNPTGAFDTTSFDTMPLDAAEAESNGFDSYFYDTQTYDYNEASRTPKKLSRIYTFTVAVTDGINQIGRTFKIYVVTEDFMKSDNSLLQVDTNLFQADGSGDRRPFWITDSYLGRWRANNYVTIYLDVYDPPSLEGTIAYFKTTNPGTYRFIETGEIIYNGRFEVSGIYPYFPKAAVSLNRTSFRNTDEWEVISPETESVFPPGTEIDTITGELAGEVPYQAAVTRTYTFTVLAVNFPIDLTSINYTLVGDWDSTVDYQVNEAVRFQGLIYICIQAHRNQPPTTTEFWSLGVSTSERTFTVDIIGEIESAIEWLSNSDLGTIKPNQPSRLSVKAQTLMYGGRISYDFVSGELPPGLTFLPTGDIEGKVKQFADENGAGLTRFYDRDSSTDDSTGTRSFRLTFDNDLTSFDRLYNFTIRAKDYANVAESDRTFSIRVEASTEKTFANIYSRSLSSKEKRLEWFDFITNSTIFKPSDIYRYGDPNFGIQSELKILMFAGIESVEAVKYIQAMSRNHYRKRLQFGEVRKGLAKDPTTQEPLYEAIYVDVVDPYEINGKSISDTIELKDDINSKVLVSYDAIKIDSDIPLVSDSDHQRIFPNSIKNMRRRIRDIGERDREFLPLWMRSIQDEATYELGYTKALVLCYAKPGSGDDILARIRASGFDFKKIDFEIDRYIIDIIDGKIEDKYLAFPQIGEKLP